ncbi:MAG: FMN-binding protein [Bacteroidales bacterium]|nr:FMN-binding protein [Bacteroidales bacterium]
MKSLLRTLAITFIATICVTNAFAQDPAQRQREHRQDTSIRANRPPMQDTTKRRPHGKRPDRATIIKNAEQEPIPEVTALLKNNDGSYTVNTSAIGAKVIGFNGRVPLLIKISKKGVVEKVEALENKETPRFMERASAILDKWNNLKVKKALKKDVDAVSGATYTSNAIKENVRLGLEYYKKNK